jgi:hypothetical protein
MNKKVGDTADLGGSEIDLLAISSDAIMAGKQG